MAVSSLVLFARCKGRRDGRVVAGINEIIDGVLNSDQHFFRADTVRVPMELEVTTNDSC